MVVKAGLRGRKFNLTPTILISRAGFAEITLSHSSLINGHVCLQLTPAALHSRREVTGSMWWRHSDGLCIHGDSVADV